MKLGDLRTRGGLGPCGCDGRYVRSQYNDRSDVVQHLRGHSSLPFDVHLMITEPERYIEAFAKSGADIITVHVEASKNIGATLDSIRELGKKVGLSLNPETPFKAVRPFIDRIDLLLIMTVHPGFGGQSFMSEMLPK